MGRAGINALAAEHAQFLIEAELPVRIEREDFAGTDTDTCTAIHAFALVKADTVFENVNPGPETYHRVAYQLTLIIRYIDQGLALR